LNARTRWIVWLMVLTVPFAGLGQSARNGRSRDADDRIEQSETSSTQRETAPVSRDDPQRPEAARQPGSFSIDLSANKGFDVSYGFGSTRGFSFLGKGGNELRMDQSLTVAFSATALDSIFVDAKLDDQQPSALQQLRVRLDTARLDGILGDFSLKGFGSGILDRRVLGLQLAYSMGAGAQLAGFFSVPEGRAVSKEFAGTTATETVEFARYRENDAWIPATYRFHIEGLEAISLEEPFIDGFSEVEIEWVGGGDAENALSLWGMRDILPALALLPPSSLTESSYVVLPGTPERLVLLGDPRSLLRKLLEQAIEAHNENTDTDMAVSYPFREGSSSELSFLEALLQSTRLRVGDRAYRFETADPQRYYILHRAGVVEDTLTVSISRDGVAYRVLDAAELEAREVQLFAEEGILSITLPEELMTLSRPALRVRFSYALSMGFSLGMGASVIPGSERVYLNGTLLETELDYVIDYELGLITFSDQHEVRESDVVRVDFEVYGSGGGDGTDYATYLYGARLEAPALLGAGISLGAARSVQDMGSVEDPSKIPTMPNDHEVIWADYVVELDSTTLSIETGYAIDEAPFDVNQKPHQPNQINALTSTNPGMVLFGHNAGLTSYDGVLWRSYGAISHLPSTRIHALAAVPNEDLLLIGTDQGLSVVRLEGPNPLEFAGNWSTLRAASGLPGNDVREILVRSDQTVWISTTEGIASIPLQELDSIGGWQQHEQDLGLSTYDTVTVLREGPSSIAIGTSKGVYILDDREDRAALLEGTRGQFVHDLLMLPDGKLVIASDRGLQQIDLRSQRSWIHEGEAVYCVAWDGEELLYGTSHGLYVSGARVPELEGTAITALRVLADSTLWVGTKADIDSGLVVWSQDTEPRSFRPEVTKIPAEDPHNYQDVPRSELREEGFNLTGSVSQWTDAYRLDVDAYYIQGGFRRIGSITRSDKSGWDIALETSLWEDAVVELRHRFSILGQARGALTTSWNSAELSWENARVTLLWEGRDHDHRVRGYEDFTLTAAAAVDRWSLWNDALTLDGFWEYEQEKGEHERRASTAQSAVIEARWNAWEAVDLHGSWSTDRRLLGGERREQVSTLSLDSGWAFALTWLDIETAYALVRTASALGREVDWDHEGGVTLSFPSASGRDWQLTASGLEVLLDLSNHVEHAVIANADFSLGVWDIDARAKHTVTDPGTSRVDTNDSVRVLVEVDAEDTARLSVSGTASRRVLEVGNRTRNTGSVDLIATLKWRDLPEGVQDRTTFRWKASYAEQALKNGRIELGNSLDLDLSSSARVFLSRLAGQRIASDLDFQLESVSTLEHVVRGGIFKDISLKSGFDLVVQGSSNWTVSIGLSGVVGQEAKGTWFHALLVQVNLDIPFNYAESY